MGKQSSIKILMTGASSFVGSRLFLYLKKQHYDVVGISRQEHDDFIQGDIHDKQRMIDIIHDTQPDIVIHCAGITPHTATDDHQYQDVNVEASKNIVEAIKGNDIGFINCSSLSVYGHPKSDDGFVREGDVCCPLSPYGQSKRDFENYLSDQKNLRFVNLRIANIPGKDGFVSHVVKNNDVTFHGDDPYIRDYIHPDDLCAIMLKSIHYLINGGDSVTLNAGAGQGFSFPHFVDLIEQKTGKKG